MAIRVRKGLWALGAVGLLVLGLVSGGWWGAKFFSLSSLPPDIPIPQLLAETHLLLDKGALVEAEKDYQAVLARDPNNPEAIAHLGNIAAQRGDIERALLFYDEALRRDPAYAHALWDKGLALQAKGDDVGAIQAWEAFAPLFPPDSQDVITVKEWIAEAQARLAAKIGGSRPLRKFP